MSGNACTNTFINVGFGRSSQLDLIPNIIFNKNVNVLFVDATELTKFNYNEYKVTRLKVNKYAPNLETISINNNNILEIDEKAFQGLQQLQIIYLQHNKINALSSETFMTLLHLIILIYKTTSV